MSSANFNILPVTPPSKSLMYTKNKIGPIVGTEPCGTPLETDFQLKTSPCTTSLCLLSVSHCSIQLILQFPIPRDFNLRISLCCVTPNNEKQHIASRIRQFAFTTIIIIHAKFQLCKPHRKLCRHYSYRYHVFPFNVGPMWCSLSYIWCSLPCRHVAGVEPSW